MSKILTDELIEQKLKEKGISMYNGDDNALAKLQDYYEFELTDSYNRTPDYSIFAESTADGYEVYIATNSPRNPSINEDVYYYDNDLGERLEDALIDGARIYVDYLQDDYVQYAAEQVYDHLYEELLEETENELIDEGYEYEKETEVA